MGDNFFHNTMLFMPNVEAKKSPAQPEAKPKFEFHPAIHIHQSDNDDPSADVVVAGSPCQIQKSRGSVMAGASFPIKFVSVEAEHFS